MPNPSQPTISEGAIGAVVRRLQRALRRTPNLGIIVDGVFGPLTETAVTQFQEGSGLLADGVVGPATWNALPDGGPMPTLEEGSLGAVVRALQTVLTNAPGNGAPIGGLKVVAASGWFAARPSGTEDVYKLYAESFRGPEHLAAIQDQARQIIAAAIG